MGSDLTTAGAARGGAHVLLLAYHFPPLGGAGPQRNTKVARHLPELGYRLSVVTGPGAPSHRWAPIDPTLDAEIPPEVAVHRLPGPEPSWTGSRMQRWLRLKRVWQRWWEEHAIPVALDAGRDASVVYASVSPYSTADSAATIARRLGKPLVLDLEDPWALDEMFVHETRLHARLERRTMGKALAAADAIVMNTPEAAARVLQTFPHLQGIPIVSIVNGYDAEDFRSPPPTRDEGVFRLVHTGSLHTAEAGRPGLVRRLRGGAMPGVDVSTRSLLYLRRALEELLAEHPAIGRRIELHVAGKLTDADRSTLGGLPLVREHGFLSHEASIALMRSADLLFLPLHDVPPGKRIAIVPCKTYEYLASRRPILAAVPGGDARDFLEEAGNALLCRPSDVSGMKTALLDAYSGWAEGETPTPPSIDLLRRLERRTLTAQVADVIEAVVPAQRLERPPAAALA